MKGATKERACSEFERKTSGVRRLKIVMQLVLDDLLVLVDVVVDAVQRRCSVAQLAQRLVRRDGVGDFLDAGGANACENERVSRQATTQACTAYSLMDSAY